MDTISTNIAQIAAARTVTNVSNINKTYNIDSRDISNFTKQLSEDDKNKAVSNRQDNTSNPALYNFQFQPNVPVAVLTDTNEFYNDAQKQNVKNSKTSPASEDEAESSDYFVEESPENNQQNGLGYYIVDNNLSASKGKSQKPISPMQARINKTYNLNFKFEPGTLVNVVYY